MSWEQKFWWVLLLVAGFGVIAMTNCGDDSAKKPTPDVQYTQTDRFEIANHKTDAFNPDLWTITDKDTKCQYLFMKEGYSGGLVLMPNTCSNGEKK